MAARLFAKRMAKEIEKMGMCATSLLWNRDGIEYVLVITFSYGREKRYSSDPLLAINVVFLQPSLSMDAGEVLLMLPI